MLNLKTTHRATTAMREAFENGLRMFAFKNQSRLPEGKQPAYLVADALTRNAGVYRRPDVTLNVSTRTWKQLAQLKAV